LNRLAFVRFLLQRGEFCKRTKRMEWNGMDELPKVGRVEAPSAPPHCT
jgi:hypothetical protein